MELALTRDQETGRKTFYREQVRACTNPPSIAPALHAAANERCACISGVTSFEGCDFKFCNGKLIQFKAINKTGHKTDVWLWH